MAQLAMSRHRRHTSSIGSIGVADIVHANGPVELLPNLQFSFPMRPEPSNPLNTSAAAAPTTADTRPVSMQSSNKPSHNRASSQRRSVSTLPTFNFNSADTSGLAETEPTPPTTPGASAPTTPLRAMRHRRGGSEFIGGDSTYGAPGLMSTSPTKGGALPLPEYSTKPGPLAGRRGHAHHRSGAISGHDLSSILQPRNPGVTMQSTSAPSTPLGGSSMPTFRPPFERSVSETRVDDSDPFGSDVATTPGRLHSQPRVQFCDDLVFIPRPLSTISSETESSTSTVRGHSVTNSISSVMSMAATSPVPARMLRPSLSTTVEDDAKNDLRCDAKPRTSMERGSRWLRTESVTLKRPLSDSAAESPNLPFSTEEPATPRLPQKKKHFLGLDRRRSEPLMGANILADPTRSTLSLHAPAAPELKQLIRTPFGNSHSKPLLGKRPAKNVRSWAASLIGRKSREPASDFTNSRSNSNIDNRDHPISDQHQRVTQSEPDLDELFGRNSADFEASSTSVNVSKPKIDIPVATFQRRSNVVRPNSDDMSPSIDLDAALGPYGTPSMSWDSRPGATNAASRRQLHSSRLNRDFSGPGMNYHRRAESAPALVPFEFVRASTPTKSAMADVFEEEEDEETTAGAVQSTRSRMPVRGSEQEEGMPVGIQVVETDGSSVGSDMNCGVDDGLGIQHGREQRPMSVHNRASPRSITSPAFERRASSTISNTIIEESNQVEIVADHEEPRTSSLTKSSDSSETPTLPAAEPPKTLALPKIQRSLMTPESYSTSAFSSPDFALHQSSFDTSRMGTRTSSMFDNRTVSSFATGEPGPEMRMSVDDVPSLTSSRSTMTSTAHANHSQRDIADRSSSIASATVAQRQQKRSSIASLSRLVGGSFGERSKPGTASRPQTSAASSAATKEVKTKKEHRLSKLMFWRSKSAPKTVTLAQ
ncbi:hypothetical protein LTR50_000378 [Elasticomyces elasticus]|nr:hypothetical protein LTR50_000378 [Elasticomyces elasticus]